MLPQAVVRNYARKLVAKFNGPSGHRCGLILVLVLSATGCKSPFAPRGNPEPSFDRLLEIENGSVSAFSPATSNDNYAQQQVEHRRPGKPASARFSEAEQSDEPLKATEQVAKSRKISDQDEELSEVPDPQLRLLRQTQLALKNTIENPPEPEDIQPNRRETSAASQKKSRRNSDDEIVFHLSDGSTDVEDDAKKPKEKLIAQRSSKSKANTATATARPANDEETVIQSVSYESGGPDRGVQPAFATEEKEVDLSWQQHLHEAVRLLNQSSGENLTNPQIRVRQAMITRLLALSLNDREAMLESIDGLQPQEQDYISHQLSALFDAMDPEANPVSGRKWSLVMLNQRKANNHLASLSNLEINHMAFCTEVIDFGVTTPFSANKFSPDQEVLLYLELDNFVSEKSKDGKGYETQLQGSYEIVDSNGRRVADQMLPADSHICKNVRRDYFIAYRVYMPAKIGSGNYTMKLTIEDLKGRKFGQSDIQFQIQ